jgi:hypothetical protein
VINNNNKKWLTWPRVIPFGGNGHLIKKIVIKIWALDRISKIPLGKLPLGMGGEGM